MSIGFWIRRFVTVFGICCAILFGVRMLRGYTLEDSATYALLWGAITAVVFLSARIYQSRRKQHCAICQDTPEMRDGDAPFTRPAGR